jgi:hypothetical protein
MNRRLILAGLAATGGLVTSAFLQVAVAAADTGADVVSATGADAFTIGNYTFDPFTSPGVEGFDLVSPLSSAPPLLTLGGGTIDGILPLAQQDFEVFNPSTGADLGSIDTTETVSNLLGLTNAEFTVTSDTAASGGSASNLPTVGSVYDDFNLGNGYENIYTAIPSTTGGSDAVTDTLVTPYGDVNLDSLFGTIDAAAPLSPGDAFTGLEAGDSSIGADAFSIGGFTLDPTLAAGGEGFTPVAPLATTPPVLELGGGGLGNPADAGNDFAPQSFDVYSGSGSSATDVGTITTGEDVTNLLGFTNTQLIVTGATPTGDGTAAELPTVGSVYDAFNLGNGFENVYTDIPGTGGGADTITDTLVTPFGNVNLDSLFGSIDAAAPMQPGDAFTGLEAGDSSIGADAFTIGDTTFDPILQGGGQGFDPVFQILGAPPLLEIGGGTPNIDGFTLPIATQDFDVYSGSGAGATEVGSIVGNEDVTNLLGLTNTEFTVASVTGTSSDLPTVGSVYDVFNLGDGIENVYTAIPGASGAADTITDTLVTPLGNLNLDSLFGGIDATAGLDPGDAFTAGLDAASAAATAVDPLAFLGL